ncbi:MAG: class I SAM-dependent methyltransferase [Candidatus Brocadiia bacterium]
MVGQRNSCDGSSQDPLEASESEPRKNGKAEATDRYHSTHFRYMAEVPNDETCRAYEAFAEYLPERKDARILDFGAGNGLFLYYLKTQGYQNVVGLEAYREQVEYVREHVTEKIYLSREPVKFLREHRGEHDLVTMFNVIEHIEKGQIVSVLRAIRESLAPGGHLLISTPNMARLTGGLYSRYLDFTHEVGFVETSLKQVLWLAGFCDIEIRPDRLWSGSLHPRSLLAATVRFFYRQMLKLVYFIERPGETRPSVYISPCLVAFAAKVEQQER